jgi:serine/threonine-protein kinase
MNIAYDQERVIEFEDRYDAWVDAETGLMWEVKPSEEMLEHEYVWSSEWVSRVVYMPENLTDDVKDIFSYVQKLNFRKHGTFDDWRVPTKEELATLQTEESANGYFIKKPLSKNTRDYEWSATTKGSPEGEAWLEDFYAGDAMDSPKSETHHIRCVRGEMTMRVEKEPEQSRSVKKKASERLKEKVPNRRMRRANERAVGDREIYNGVLSKRVEPVK